MGLRENTLLILHPCCPKAKPAGTECLPSASAPGALSGEHKEGPAEVPQELFISAPGSEQAGVCHLSGEQEASALGEGQPM